MTVAIGLSCFSENVTCGVGMEFTRFRGWVTTWESSRLSVLPFVGVRRLLAERGVLTVRVVPARYRLKVWK